MRRMNWKKFTIKTRAEAEEVITGILADLDIYSVEIEDSVPLTESEKARMFVDIAPARENDGSANISFYLDETQDYRSLLPALRSALEEYKANTSNPFRVDLGPCTISTEDTEDADWINNWKRYFSAFYIDDILFVPSWESQGKTDEELREEIKRRGEKEPPVIIHIDPGIAFGTGKHETTQLCIRELRNLITVGDRVLDVGTGSGVLSMLAFKFGAGQVMATDLDEAAISSCDDNLKRNCLEDADFKLIIGNIIDDKKVQDEAGYDCYDVVVANILADVLIPLTPVAAAALKKGGSFITSGIIEGREGDVEEAMRQAGLHGIETRAMGEWRLVVGRK